jgi:hypothetical protein
MGLLPADDIREQTEVLVFSQQNSHLGTGQSRITSFSTPGIDLCDRDDVMAGVAESGDDC